MEWLQVFTGWLSWNNLPKGAALVATLPSGCKQSIAHMAMTCTGTEHSAVLNSLDGARRLLATAVGLQNLPQHRLDGIAVGSGVVHCLRGDLCEISAISETYWIPMTCLKIDGYRTH